MLWELLDFWTFLVTFGHNVAFLYRTLFHISPLLLCGISCFYVFFWTCPWVRMSVLRWHRLSALWKSWMFNQEPAEEQGQNPDAQAHEDKAPETEGVTFKDCSSDHQSPTGAKTQNLDYRRQKSENDKQNLEIIDLDAVPKLPKSELLQRSCSEPCSQVSICVDRPFSCSHQPDCSNRTFRSEDSVDCVLQVDNSSEGNDNFLQREGSQRRSRRRFRRVNPRGERELITDGQEHASFNTVRGETLWATKENTNL